ncbi:MAG: hypothetical protein ACT4PT_14375 [Methanobacteriota archaeon]
MTTKVGSFLTGIYPRSEELVQATRDADRGRVPLSEVEKALARDVKTLVAGGVAARLTYVSDGHLSWQDHFRPLVEHSTGLSVGALTRYYDNNSFYRAPVRKGTPKLAKPLSAKEWFHSDALPEGHAWKADLPSPWWFAKATENVPAGKAEDTLFAFAEHVLRPQAVALAKAGCSFIEFLDPEVVVRPPDEDGWEHLRQAVEVTTKGIKAKTGFATFFASAAPVLRDLAELPVDVLGIDFLATDLEAVAEIDLPRGLAAGVVDGRASLVETPDHLVAFAREAASEIGPRELFLTSNCDLEYVPERIASEKLAALGKAVKTLGASL